MPISATGSSAPRRSPAAGGRDEAPARPRAPAAAAAGSHEPAERGFTLIELMVVIAIIAIASAAVTLAFPDPRGSLRGEAERFAARVRAAQDMAIMRAQPIALVARADGYRFEARSQGRWTPLLDRPFGPERWSAGASARIAGNDRARAVFDPTGVGDPLDLVLVRDGARVGVHVGVDGTVDVAG